MPLPTQGPRRLLHRRTIMCRGYEREDGQFEVDASVTDEKALGTSLADHSIGPGEVVHGMSMRLSIDGGLTLTRVVAVTEHAPFAICGTIVANFERLIGLKLVKGFTKHVREIVGGIKGCVHLVDLLSLAATVAHQTMGRKWRLEAAASAAPAKPALINTCHAWASDSPVIKRDYPGAYTERT